MSAVRNFDKRKNVNGLIYTILLHDNVLYFLGVTGLLIFNNLMVVVSRRPSHFTQERLSNDYLGCDKDPLVQLWTLPCRYRYYDLPDAYASPQSRRPFTYIRQPRHDRALAERLRLTDSVDLCARVHV